jgi:hypothetical protein
MFVVPELGADAGRQGPARLPAGRALHVNVLMAKRLTATQRRALAILADSGLNGSTVDGMLTGGFKLPTISRLVRNGSRRRHPNAGALAAKPLK